MSRLGKKPIPIPDKVKVEVKGNVVEFTGPAGKLSKRLHDRVNVTADKGHVLIKTKGETPEDSMMQGLARGMIIIAMEGVVSGFKKDLEIHGLGYKAVVEGKSLVMQIGFSHPVKFDIPEGIKIVVEKATLLSISGVDKTLVGETAARIRQSKPPEPYQGTGIRYVGEHIIRKAGKAAAGGATGAVKK
ncbi:MAG: 50S ribosomal protein L6 [Elusimicrobia bacterium RIFOXYA2_FULL_50_26]|nr:MAG: 50S ribosomal protein L6 [Elusimicrobia bacterium RIFOXYA2_FULL_50_26]OGS25203.1 MAG: 50S ribosomal protein L6 [Elusimicrobia bacterium RIFOXYB2_FULL_50_12]